MRPPISAIIGLSEVFLEKLDEEIINIIKSNEMLGCYFRYIDGTLYISQNNGINITWSNLANSINNSPQNINYQ